MKAQLTAANLVAVGIRRGWITPRVEQSPDLVVAAIGRGWVVRAKPTARFHRWFSALRKLCAPQINHCPICGKATGGKTCFIHRPQFNRAAWRLGLIRSDTDLCQKKNRMTL